MHFRMNIVLKMAGIMIAVIFIFAYLASAAPFLVSDPQCKFDGANNCALEFQISKDGVIWFVADSQDIDTDQIKLHHDLAGEPDGNNDWKVKAVNAWGSSTPVPFVFIKGVPSAPNGIRITGE